MKEDRVEGFLLPVRGSLILKISWKTFRPSLRLDEIENQSFRIRAWITYFREREWILTDSFFRRLRNEITLIDWGMNYYLVDKSPGPLKFKQWGLEIHYFELLFSRFGTFLSPVVFPLFHGEEVFFPSVHKEVQYAKSLRCQIIRARNELVVPRISFSWLSMPR